MGRLRPLAICAPLLALLTSCDEPPSPLPGTRPLTAAERDTVLQVAGEIAEGSWCFGRCGEKVRSKVLANKARVALDDAATCRVDDSWLVIGGAWCDEDATRRRGLLMYGIWRQSTRERSTGR